MRAHFLVLVVFLEVWNCSAADHLHRQGGYVGYHPFSNSDTQTPAQRLLQERGLLVPPRRVAVQVERTTPQQSAQRRADPESVDDDAPTIRDREYVPRRLARFDPPDPNLAAAGGLISLGLMIFLIVLGILWILMPLVLYSQLLQLRAIRGLLERTTKMQAAAAFGASPRPASPTPKPAPPSPVDITCPTCAHPFSAVPGIATDCPRCGEHVRVDPSA